MKIAAACQKDILTGINGDNVVFVFFEIFSVRIFRQ